MTQQHRTFILDL